MTEGHDRPCERCRGTGAEWRPIYPREVITDYDPLELTPIRAARFLCNDCMGTGRRDGQ